MNRLGVPVILVVSTALVVGAGGAMLSRAKSGTNDVALASSPKPVTVVAATADSFRATHRYVATTVANKAARIGPQLISAAYVDTVLVRPGAVVKRGDVLATLDCARESAQLAAISAQARALEVTQQALAKQASRVESLGSNFASPDEIETKEADAASKQAQLLGVKAEELGTSLEVHDCVLRAPFAGEVSDRFVDPGAFVTKGTPIVAVVDRSSLLIIFDVPETDYFAVAPGTPVKVKLLATKQELTLQVARRAPGADPQTRTVHVELELPDDDDKIPIGTTADLTVEIGDPQPATRIPLVAANVRNGKASVFEVDDQGVAHKVVVPVVGERGSDLLVSPDVKPGTRVVTEGRAALVEKDHVEAKSR